MVGERLHASENVGILVRDKLHALCVNVLKDNGVLQVSGDDSVLVRGQPKISEENGERWVSEDDVVLGSGEGAGLRPQSTVVLHIPGARTVSLLGLV